MPTVELRSVAPNFRLASRNLAEIFLSPLCSINDVGVDYSDCPAAMVGEMERRRGDALRLIERAG